MKIELTHINKISLRKSIPTLPFNIYSLDNDTFYKKRKESFDFYGFNNRNRFLDLIKYFLLHDAIIDDKSLFSNLLINEIAKNYTDNVSNIYQGFMEYFYKTKHYKEHLLDRPEKIINQIKNLNIRFEVKESNIITFLINNKFKSPINNHKCFLELYNEEISESLNKYNIHHYKLFDYFLNINKYSNNSIDTLIEYLDYFYNHLQKHPEFHNNSSIIDDNYDIDMYNFISKMLVKYHNDIEIVTNDLNKKIEIIFAPDFELCSITENANSYLRKWLFNDSKLSPHNEKDFKDINFEILDEFIKNNVENNNSCDYRVKLFEELLHTKKLDITKKIKRKLY